MTTESSGSRALPGPEASEPRTDFFATEAHRLAALWGELPAEHFKAAMAAAKAEGALLSQERVLRMRLTHEAELQHIQAEKEAAEAKARAELEVAKQAAAVEAGRLRHRRHVIDVGAGLTISLALLIVAVLVIDKAAWLSAVLCGPSLLALAKVFVLRKSDPGDMKILGKAAGGPPPAA